MSPERLALVKRYCEEARSWDAVKRATGSYPLEAWVAAIEAYKPWEPAPRP